DMEKMATDAKIDPKSVPWMREQTIAGQSIQIGLAPGQRGSGSTLSVIFLGHGGMSANVKTISDIAEVLGIALSLEPKIGGDKKAPVPSTTVSLPGKIAMPAGWKHTKEQGEDSIVGKFTRESGLTVRYDMGMLAGVYAKPEN